MIEKVRKVGIITKGIIYILIGALTFLAALNVGGKISGKNGVINFLENQPFGLVILILIATGLLMYSFWRLYAAFTDGKNKGSDKSGIVKRIGYFISGIIYGTLAISVLLNYFGSKSNTNSKKSATDYLIESEFGVLFLYIIGAILFFVGIHQFYKGYSNKFLKDIESSGKIESKKLLKKSGKFGHIARGISFIIFSLFVVLAAYKKNAGAVKGIEGMFNFLQDFSWGNILMGLMALGFLCYGIYQYFLARYSKLY